MNRAIDRKRHRILYANLPPGSAAMGNDDVLTDEELDRLAGLVVRLSQSTGISISRLCGVCCSEKFLSVMRRIPEDDKLILALGGLVGGEKR